MLKMLKQILKARTRLPAVLSGERYALCVMNSTAYLSMRQTKATTWSRALQLGLPHVLCFLLVGELCGPLSRMQAKSTWTLGPGVRIMAVERDGDRWVISATAREIGSCPGCGARSRRRHSRYSRCLQDLPAQGAIVALRVLMTRWRCLNRSCARKTFSDQLPGVAIRHARRTLRVSRLL